MAIDPNIILNIGQNQRQPIGQTFNRMLSSIGKIDSIKQNRLNAPIQNELLQQRQQSGQQGIEAEANKQRLTSVAQGAAELFPFLQNNDVDGALSTLTARRSRLASQGRDTSDTDEAIQMVTTGQMDLLKQRAGNAIKVGIQQGVLKRPNAGQTSELQTRNALLATLEDPNASEDRKKSARIALKLDAGAGRDLKDRLQFEQDKQQITGDIEVDQDIRKARGVTREKFREQTLALPELERVKFLSKNRFSFEADISESKNVLEEIERAIEIWETAPGTISGPAAHRLPALADDTQELESILAGLGIDRLSSFKGATSERELATAFRAGASIEQDAKAGIRRLMKQRRDIARNNERLSGLLRESKALLRRQPQQNQSNKEIDLSDPNLSIEDLEAELARLEGN